jgi:hypothetical protein
MHSSKLRAQHRHSHPKNKKPTFREALTVTKDLLDVILKISVLLLFVPAIALAAYLRAIDRVDLFVPAVFSGSGLAALLMATVLLIAGLLIGVFGASWFIAGLASTYDKDRDPPKGTVWLAIATVIVALAILFGVYVLQDTRWMFLGRNATAAALALSSIALLTWLAYVSPPRFRIVTDNERSSWKERLTRAFARVALCALGAAFTTSSVATLYALSRPYRIPEQGWQGNTVAAVMMLVSVLPGLGYLNARTRGASKSRCLMAAAGGIMIALAPLLSFRTSLEPLFLVSMKAMGIMEVKARTFELLNTKEKATYQMLGFSFKRDTTFFDGVIRFQFGDIKLVCVDAYDAIGQWPGTAGFMAPPPPDASAPRTACVSATKDEVRVVSLSPTSANPGHNAIVGPKARP